MSTNTHPRIRSRPLRRTLVVVGCTVVFCSAMPLAASAQTSPRSGAGQNGAATYGVVGVQAQVRDAREIWIGPALAHTLTKSPATLATGGSETRLEEGSVLGTAESLGAMRLVTIAHLGT